MPSAPAPNATTTLEIDVNGAQHAVHQRPKRWGAAAALLIAAAIIVAIVLIAIALRCGRAKLHSDELFMRTNGALYLRYDEGAYYWEVLILLRKLLLLLGAKIPLCSASGSGTEGEASG